MNKAVLSNRIYLSRTKPLHDYLLEKLSYQLPPKRPGLPSEYYCDVTRINDNILTIPIGRIDLIPKEFEIEDKRIINPVNFPKFKHTLRDDQKEVFNQIHDSCIISAKPGWGKTFTAISIAKKLGQKTLVVVHTKKLFEQWIEEVENTLNIKAGVIGDGKYNINSPIVIGINRSLQTRLDKIRSEFGTIILDEVHHLPATVFKSIIDACRARYKIGLSATLWRKDGKHVMLHDYTGTSIFNAKDRNRIQANIVVVNSGIPFSSDPKKHWANRVNELVQNPQYIELVLNLSQAQAQRGHKVLTVSDRVEFLETCGHVMPNFQTITGSTSDEKVDLVNHDGIFGGSKIFSEGVDYPILSSLIMAQAINNRALLEQLIGRIERVYMNKPYPEAIDIALEGKTAKYQLSQRINFYIDRGYRIKYI
jgi:superfamily II DNA or RNA helicase